MSSNGFKRRPGVLSPRANRIETLVFQEVGEVLKGKAWLLRLDSLPLFFVASSIPALYWWLLACSLFSVVSCKSPPPAKAPRVTDVLPGPTLSEYGDRAGPRGFHTVVIDAGHGGKDTGARGHGLVEKEIALNIALRLKRILRSQFKVKMTRTWTFVPLDERVEMANRDPNAILVSVHLNHGPARLSGPETYYLRPDSYALAKRIHQNLLAIAPEKNASRGLVRRRLRLTRNPGIPCVLVECGYLSNKRDAALLATSDYRERVAKAIADAIRDQARLGDAGMGPLPKPLHLPPSKATDARDRS